MNMERKFYEENVDMMVELETEDGYKDRTVMKGSEVTAFVNSKRKQGYFFSDVDFCCNQSNEEVKHFLNVVFYNWKHNKPLTEKYGSVWQIIDTAIDNKWDYN